MLTGVINDYSFIKPLGRGGFSTVYLVKSLKYNNVYVAKVTPIPTEPTSLDATEAEITALMNLSHPNIIKFFDHFTHGTDFIMILEYCSGGCLQNILESGHGLPLPNFISYGRQILSALAFCHKKNIAHRDIKPGNILLDSEGRVKLSDFGIALTDADQLHQTFSGSLLYEPPEVINKKAHNPMLADIWSLGVLFAYMINGSLPWHCDNIGLLKARISAAKYKLRSSTPPDVAALIGRMIVVDPTERPTAEQLLNDPLFRIDKLLEKKLSDPDIVPDALSPRGRKKSKSFGLYTSKDARSRSKAINIFKMNYLVGSSPLPKLKTRYHETRDTFVLSD